MKSLKKTKIISYLFLVCFTTVLYTSDSLADNPESSSNSNVPQIIYDLEDPF